MTPGIARRDPPRRRLRHRLLHASLRARWQCRNRPGQRFVDAAFRARSRRKGRKIRARRRARAAVQGPGVRLLRVGDRAVFHSRASCRARGDVPRCPAPARARSAEPPERSVPAKKAGTAAWAPIAARTGTAPARCASSFRAGRARGRNCDSACSCLPGDCSLGPLSLPRLRVRRSADSSPSRRAR